MKRYKILLLADHILSTSGVGTQGRWLSQGLVNTGKYSVRNFGAAIKHSDYELVQLDENLKILPVDGFGTKEMLRQALVTEQPDCIVLFTDPRFFVWVWEMADEIHQVCPIAYNHLWDNYPYPEFNDKYYESTDLLNCINWPTFQMLKSKYPEKTHYIPHALPEDIYKPLPKEDIKKIKKDLVKDEDRFIGLWVNRNAKRKMPNDILYSWSLFSKELKEKHIEAKDPILIMHTDPKDSEGPDLVTVAEKFGIKDKVMFSSGRIDFHNMNILYNVSDFVVNRSSAEGFGLSTLEAMFSGKPIIAIETGGLTRQVKNPYTGEEYGIPLPVEVKSIIGTQNVPYIYEDHISHQTLSNAFMKMFEFGPEKREQIGLRAREYVRQEYSMANLISKWDITLENTILTWREKRKNYNITTF
jgi:glycosyltransferase involved in cell wall biosynthesis